MTDELYLRAAIAEAQAAEAAGEVPIGAVIVSPTGDIVARGNNRVLRDHDPTAHAEIVALRAAGAVLGNHRMPACEMFVTIEPCAMCAGALIQARLKRLVFGAKDPKAGAVGSVVSLLDHSSLNHRMEIVSGVLQEECSQVLQYFFRNKRGSY